MKISNGKKSGDHGKTKKLIKLKLNPWGYSSEEPRPTEVIAANGNTGALC